MDNNALFCSFYHPPSPSTHITTIRQSLLKDGYVIDNIHIDEKLPQTPTDTGYVAEELIPKAVSGLMGHLSNLRVYPVVYQGENDGRLIRHVVPRQNMEHSISSYGSKESFLPHVDNPDLSLRSEIDKNSTSPCPDTLSLLYLRQQQGVATSIIKLTDVLSDLSELDIKLLQDAVFNVSRPASFKNKSTATNLPLVDYYDGNYISRFDYHNVYSDSQEHQKALEKLKASALDSSKWLTFYLNPSQVITFDNQRVFHTRNGFTPRFDGSDRWLLRVFGLYNKPSDQYLHSSQCSHHLKS